MVLKCFLSILLFLFCFSFTFAEGIKNPETLNTRRMFVHTEGKYLTDGNGKPLLLMGISFNNDAWNDYSNSRNKFNNLPDYQKVAGMGFNCVRLYLNYRWFEEDKKPYQYKKSGFMWLDQSIQWARSSSILLILALYIPQGGMQNEGKGIELWTNRQIQNRFIALWQEFARRYSNEPDILGYDILHSPCPSENIGQWEDLANETVRVIRREDTNHVIIVERAETVANNTMNDNLNGDMNFFKVNDSNIMYGFLFYKPMAFTYQGIPWSPAVYGVISHYPDENISEIAGNFEWKITATNNTKPPIGFTDWYFYESAPFTVNDPQVKFGIPVAQGNHLGFFDSALYDDISIEELDSSGKKVRSWFAGMESNDYWYLFDGREFIQGVIDPYGGRKGSHALKISGPTENAGLNGVFHLFPVTQGNSYKISGWIKTANFNKSSQIGLRLDFYSSDGEVMKRNKAYIEKELDRLTAWRDKANAPIYLCEFGCIRYAFEFERGGPEWVSDVMDACLVRGINYNYRSYYDEYFGLNLPDVNGFNRMFFNQSLYELFIQKQAGKRK